MNHEGTTVFSKQGFIKVGKGRNQPSDYVSHDDFVLEGINKQIFANLPLFRKLRPGSLYSKAKVTYNMTWTCFDSSTYYNYFMNPQSQIVYRNFQTMETQCKVPKILKNKGSAV